MSGFVCAHVSFGIASHKTYVTYQVEHLVPSALVGEMKGDIAQVSLLGNRKAGLAEKAAHFSYLLFADGMLDNHDGIVYVSAFNQAERSQILQLVEEAESPAVGNLANLVGPFVP